jgi:hypothetical protein
VKTKTILDAIDDPKLFGPWFKKRASFENWLTFLAALFGLPMTPDQLTVYQQCTGREVPPATPINEVWLCIGRRGGKSFILALIAVWLSAFHEYRQYLTAGERATVVIIAADRKQARTIFRYIKGMLNGIPMLARMIERETADTFDLTNRVSIEIHVASFRSSRGYTIIAALCDEIAFWRSDESANPDKEILSSLRPAMATIPGSMLLCASSPYARRGVMYATHKKHFGNEGSPILVWQAPTRTMNPSVPQHVIDEAYEEDRANADAEFGAQFRTDVESFISREVVEACVIRGRYELPRTDGCHYIAFTDPAGGSGKDAMTLTIGHMEGDRFIVDLVRSRNPPFSPDDVTQEFCGIIKSYGIATVIGDNYANMWPCERFAVYGIDYQKANLVKSDIYLAFLPMMNSGRVELLDHPKMIAQLCDLDRRPGSVRDIIDHQPNQHDDLINSVAGCAVYAAQRRTQELPIVAPILVSGGPRNIPGSDTVGRSGGYDFGQYGLQPGQTPEAFAAKERAKLPFHKLHPDAAPAAPPRQAPVPSPSIPDACAGAALESADENLTTTERFYLWNGRGRGGPP